MRRSLLVLGVVLAVLLTPSANAKDFGPGDLRVCDSTLCVAIVNPEVLPQLGAFYYSGSRLARVRQPVLGAACNELRFRNGYPTGIVATRRLDRFLSYGVHVERFEGGTWYAVPRQLSQELRQLTSNLRPLRVTRAALDKSR